MSAPIQIVFGDQLITGEFVDEPIVVTDRMDWKSMFVWDPAKRVCRLVGGEPRHPVYVAEYKARRMNYRRWLYEYRMGA